MGKKARKTRWRALSISGPQSDTESQNGEAPKKYAHHNPRATAPWQQNGHSGRYHSSHSTPTRQHHQNGYYASKSTRSSSTASDNKITFNEDEYTRITTPRQDVLFKKGYLSKPKPYLQQHHQQQQQQLTSAGNSTGDGTPDHQSADGAELGDYEYEHTSPFIFPNGFYDHNGMCYINGVHGYEPYPQMMVYNPAAVCYPPPYMNHRVKRYSTDSMAESMSPNNECTDGPSSAAPEFNPVYGFVYPDDVGGYVPYNHLPGDSQDTVLDEEEAPSAAAAEEDGARRVKKRRRRKVSRRQSDEEVTTDDEEEENGSEEKEVQEKIIEPVEAKEQPLCSVELAEVTSQPEESTAQSDTHTPANDTTTPDTEQTTNHLSSATIVVNHSDTPQSDTITTHNDTPLKELKTEDTSTTTSTTKYRVDAEEFVPRAYRAVPMPSFMPVPLVGDMYTGAFVPPPPGVAINFMPAAHYEEYLPHGYVPIPRYMEPRYSRNKRNTDNVTNPVEKAVTATENDVETSATDVDTVTESTDEATDTCTAVTESSIATGSVTAEQSNKLESEATKEVTTDSCTQDTNKDTTQIPTSPSVVAETVVKSNVPQCNTIDIAKIVSKLEQAAMEQQKIEQQRQQQHREKKQNVSKPERRGSRRPQQQQRKEEHGPTPTAQEEVVSDKKPTEIQQPKVIQEVLPNSTTEPSTPATMEVPSIVSTTAVTSTTPTNVVNYSDKLKTITARPATVVKKPPVVSSNQKQHTCPRLERSNSRHVDHAQQTNRKHTNVSYNRTDSTSDSSTHSTGNTIKRTSPNNNRTNTTSRSEQESNNKKHSRAETSSESVKPVQSTAVTSTDQWISVSSKKKRKGRQEQATSPVMSASEQDSATETHNMEQVEQPRDTVEPSTNDVVISEPTTIAQDTVKEPTTPVKAVEPEPQTIEQNVVTPIVESTTSTPQSHDSTARKTRNNKKQAVRKRIIINDEQLTLQHQQQQQQPTTQQQIEPQSDIQPTVPVVPEVTQLPVEEKAPVVNKLQETVEPQEPIIHTETSSDDAKTIASDELSTVTMTTTDSEQTVATATPATVANSSSSKQKRRKKKSKTAAAAVNKSALDSTSDEWTLTADEDTSLTLDSDESSKTNVEVSLEIDRMIQRGLFANLEEKLKSFNPSDSFIHSATLDIIKVAPPPPSSLDNGTKYGALGNFKNFDFSGILLSGMQQSRQHQHQHRVVDNAARASASTASTGTQQQPQQQQHKLTPAGNDTFENTFTSPEANTPTLLVNGCSEGLLEAEECNTPSATPTAEEPAGDVTPEQVQDIPPVSTQHVSRLPITRAVKEWMNRTRETTPEVEIFKRPNEIRPELLVLAVEAIDADLEQEDVVSRGTSRESSAVPDLLDCWEEPSVGEVPRTEAVEHEHNAATEPASGHIEQGEDALEMYESLYGKNTDYLNIRREVDECSRHSTSTGTLPRHARDGGLPYRAICCTVM